MNKPATLIDNKTYFDNRDRMDDRERGQLWDAVMLHATGKETEPFSDRFMASVYDQFCRCVDRDLEKYQAKVDNMNRNRNQADFIRNQDDFCADHRGQGKGQGVGKGLGQGQGVGEGSEDGRNFPSLNDVQQYAAQRGAPELAADFYHHWSACSWKTRDGRDICGCWQDVFKNRMKDKGIKEARYETERSYSSVDDKILKEANQELFGSGGGS